MIRAEVTLYGWRHSLYTQAAQITLLEKRVPFARVEVDPFLAPHEARAAGHPFARVPILTHRDFRLYETAAIAAYVDAAFTGPALTPAAPMAKARMVQAITLFDSYGFRPMIAQHYAHAIFAPMRGEPADPAKAEAGLQASEAVCAALEEIAAEGLALAGAMTLADCHIGPMLRAFALSAAGARMLACFPALDSRRQELEQRDSLRQVCLPCRD